MSKRITIIGAGPGGSAAAFNAARKGLEVTLIEAESLGGICLNYGCIPTKTMKASAEAYETVLNAKDYGIDLDGSSKINMSLVVDRKNDVLQTLRKGLARTCNDLKVNTIFGTAKIINANLVEVKKHDGSIEKIEGDYLIIATGTKPLSLASIPIDHKYILSSDDALELRTLPKSLIIIGGGVIGCELATIYHTFGSDVTIVAGQERLLATPSLDVEMSKILQREMRKTGIIFELGRMVTKAEVVDGKVHVHIEDAACMTKAKKANADILEADMVIAAVGRLPNTEGLGLQELGIETDNRGYIITNEYLETNIKNIYAIGDILGPTKNMLAHMAVAEGLVAVQNILGNQKKYDCKVCPSAIFVTPEIGSVGLSEKQALEMGYDINVELMQTRELGKAQAMGSISGAFKLIADSKTGKLLGAHIAGTHASDIIAELTLAIQLGASIDDLAQTIHAHPTLAEGVFETANRMI